MLSICCLLPSLTPALDGVLAVLFRFRHGPLLPQRLNVKTEAMFL
jgi:hypothetical protein